MTGVRETFMFTVYVLISLKNNKRYVGYTGKDVLKRLSEHNAGSNWFIMSNMLQKQKLLKERTF